MTEKRFTCHQMIADYSTGEDIDFDFLQELIDEQEQPKDLRMHISDGNKIITYRECVNLLNELVEENKQLKKDATTLIYANQDYRQQNQNLQEQLDYIQNSISEHIKHQKTELGQKALREVIQDYNDWLLGHNEVKE